VVQNNGVSTHNKSSGFGKYLRAEKRRAGLVGGCCSYTAYSSRGIGDNNDLDIFGRLAGRIMGADNRKSRRHILTDLAGDTSGDAVVEAAILFPIMIMIFAGLVLLSLYLPAQAALQRATQYAAIALATEDSDTWLFYNENEMMYFHETDRERLDNVYASFFKTANSEVQEKAETIVSTLESRSISSKVGELTVEGSITGNFLLKEAVVTAIRTYPVPVDLSFIGFPDTISVKATSTAAAVNTEEFVRSVDIASDFVEFIIDRYDLHNVKDAISSFGSRVAGLLGW